MSINKRLLDRIIFFFQNYFKTYREHVFLTITAYITEPQIENIYYKTNNVELWHILCAFGMSNKPLLPENWSLECTQF